MRHEWVGEPRRLLPTADDEPVDLSSFAYGETRALLAVEPLLLTVAALVEGCARGGVIADDAWAGIDRLASTLIGPSRSASQTTRVNTASAAVTSNLRGDVIRRRYLEALRKVASEAAGAGA